jgi:hypothetical protein
MGTQRRKLATHPQGKTRACIGTTRPLSLNNVLKRNAMKHNQEFAESLSKDSVIREMAHMANRILSDMSLTNADRAQLIRRLEAEYHAYKAWNKQYSSYFRTSRSRDTVGNQSGSALLQKKGRA